MRRGHFIRELAESGCYLKRHGKRHDIYAYPVNGKQAPVPRHPEIKETLCQLIRKRLGVCKSANLETQS
uniref:HicA toxin of toxin-antitoxin n=1 Tax=Candidatus Kentrum sp. FW TaxID=2126338 RepID=A0A450RZ13_9GAMM|nr:MAG: HicA toxin of toxin-antitoxin [Candidatus Kentron sp. FW]